MRHTFTVLILACLFATPAQAQLSDRADGMVFLPDVHSQFRALTDRPEALGFHYDGTPEPSKCRHYQNVVRVNAADGTPYLLLTRSGSTPDLTGFGLADEAACNDSDGERYMGNLVVVRMESRDKDGERMRSNRLIKGAHVDNSIPYDVDRAVTFYTTAEGGLVPGYGDNPQRVYGHPGGMQVIGHTLAMAMGVQFLAFTPPGAPPYELAQSPSQVMFFDVSDPENPVFKSSYFPQNHEGHFLFDADGIAITPLPDGHYLMAITPGFYPETVYFFRSTIGNTAAEPNALLSPNLSWTLMNGVDVPGNSQENAHQSLHFFREGSVQGDLYLAGARGHPVYSDEDRLDLYTVHCATVNCLDGETVTMTLDANAQHISPFPNTGGTNTADLAAATGFYESPSGEMIFYATQHQNDGPGNTINMGEWRHVDVVRPGSPTYLPTALVNGPYTVDEGSRVALSGSAQAPATKAWIQIFDRIDYGGEHQQAYYPIIDFKGRNLDDYDDFHTLEFQHFTISDDFSLNDKDLSWKWFAPPGCTIYAVDHAGSTVDETKTLAGDGAVHQDADLRQVVNDGGTHVCAAGEDEATTGCADDIAQEIDAVEFQPGCSTYYNSPFQLSWDLNLDGSFDAFGNSATLLAAEGPAELSVPVQAQSSAYGGPAGTAHAHVSVHNVAPRVAAPRLTDSAGHVLGTEVPFALLNLPVTMAASFTDPGLQDHQSATLAWGDGVVQQQPAFAAWNEAYGDGSGALSHVHRYSASGTYALGLSVTDDDGDSGNAGASVQVLSPEQAVIAVGAQIDAALTGASKTQTKDLDKARKALLGSNDNSNNSALNKIRGGQKQAALAALWQAVSALRDAQAHGVPGLAAPIAILEQVIAALSA